MFDLDSFEKELDEQNAALESMLNELDSVEDSSENSLLDKVQAQVNTKCTTIEACESMLAKLNNEIKEYNVALQTMKKAAESYGIDGDKDALKATINPASDIIRNKYSMITMESASTEGLVSDDQITSVRDFLIGSKAILESKIMDLTTATEAEAPEIPENEKPETTPEEVGKGTDSAVESFINSVDDSEEDIATEGLKDTIKKAKDAFVKWITGIINKFSKKEKAEKDPDKKSALSKLISKLKGIFNKGKSAESVEDVQDAKSEAEEILDEIDDEDTSASESALIEISHKELELALESCVIVQESYYNSLNEDVEIYTDDYVAATEAYYNALASDNMEVATEAFTKLKESLANVCDKLANKCFAMVNKANAKARKKVNEKEGTNLTTIKQKCNGLKALGNWFKAKAAKLRGNISESEFESAQKEVETKKSEAEKTLGEIDKFYENVYTAQYATESVETVSDSSVSDDTNTEDLNEVATEADASAGLIIAATAAEYAILIAMAVKAGMTPENKYVKRLQKEIKPKEKELKKEIKGYKRTKNYEAAIASSKKLIALYKSMISDIESLGREYDTVYKRNSDGTTSESFRKGFSAKQTIVLDKVKSNIENLTAEIKLMEMDKSKRSKAAVESELDDEFIKGYTLALEGMSIDLEDVNDDEE